MPLAGATTDVAYSRAQLAVPSKPAVEAPSSLDGLRQWIEMQESRALGDSSAARLQSPPRQDIAPSCPEEAPTLADDMDLGIHPQTPPRTPVCPEAMPTLSSNVADLELRASTMRLRTPPRQCFPPAHHEAVPTLAG